MLENNKIQLVLNLDKLESWDNEILIGLSNIPTSYQHNELKLLILKGLRERKGTEQSFSHKIFTNEPDGTGNKEDIYRGHAFTQEQLIKDKPETKKTKIPDEDVNMSIPENIVKKKKGEIKRFDDEDEAIEDEAIEETSTRTFSGTALADQFSL